MVLATIQHLSPSDLLRAIDSESSELLTKVANEQVSFWKKLITTSCGVLEVERRGDLSASQYRQFYHDWHLKLPTTFAIVLNDDAMTSITKTAIQFEVGDLEILNRMKNATRTILFNVGGTQPERGTIGIVAEYGFANDDLQIENPNLLHFVAKKGNSKELKERVLSYLSVLAYDDLSAVDIGNDNVVIGEVVFKNQEALPSMELFASAFKAIDATSGSTSHFEVVIANDDNHQNRIKWHASLYQIEF